MISNSKIQNRNGNSIIPLPRKVPLIPFRIDNLKEMFLDLLSSLQDNKLFTMNPELTKYRNQYLGEIISKTLHSNQEKLIKKLQAQICSMKIESATTVERKISFQLDLPQSNCEQDWNQGADGYDWDSAQELSRKITCNKMVQSSKTLNSKFEPKKFTMTGSTESFKTLKKSKKNDNQGFGFKYLKIRV